VLIYDHNKEFIGIDEESLKLLGYARYEDLIHEHKDIAELFVKKPGYIHNFTNFPWIDFVMHAESEESKVIIAGKEKAFSATIDISKLHLSKAPESDAYLIGLKNVKSYQLDPSERPVSAPAQMDLEPSAFNAPQEMPQPVAQPDIFAEPEPVAEPFQSLEPLTIDEDLFIQEEMAAPEEAEIPVTFEMPPVSEDLDVYFHEDEKPFVAPEPEIVPVPEMAPERILDSNEVEEKKTSKPMLGSYLTEEDKSYLADLEFKDDYVYDPSIAADELGLPVDLIEEFIGDFISQAHEFKDQLFTAIKNDDFDTIKVLSHKLKGVAANLRIEDSFEVLRNVNETADLKECEANLKKFYLTIAKLEGKDVESVLEELERPEEEFYNLTPKFDEPQVEEEILPPLNFPEPEPFEEPTPFVQESYAAPSVSQDEDSDIYDFGLNQDNSSSPFVVMEDEAEIASEIQNFAPEAQSSAPAAVLTYDINIAAGEIGLGADLLAALTKDYIDEANEMRGKLENAIATSDMMRWKAFATQLKGVSDNLRIKDISNSLQTLIDSTESNQAKAAVHEFYGFINQL